MQAAKRKSQRSEAGISTNFFVRWAANLILKNVFDSIDEKEFGVIKWDPFLGGLTNLMQVYGNVDGFPESVLFGLILLTRTRNLDVDNIRSISTF